MCKDGLPFSKQSIQQSQKSTYSMFIRLSPDKKHLEGGSQKVYNLKNCKSSPQDECQGRAKLERSLNSSKPGHKTKSSRAKLERSLNLRNHTIR